MLSWSGILTVVVMGRYEQTIVIAPSLVRATRLWYISLMLAIIGSIAIGCVALIISLLWEENPLGSFIHWIAPYVLVTATANATMMLLLRRKEYTRLGIAQGLRTISNNLIKVLLGLKYPTTLSLIVSTLAAAIIGCLPLGRQLGRGLSIRWDRRYLLYIKHYISFPLLSTPQALINILTGSLLVVMLPLGYGLKEIGLMTMIMMLVRRPLIVLSDSVGQVYFERMSEYIRGSISPLPLIEKLILATLAIGLPICIMIYYLVDWAVLLLLGDRWAELPHIIVCMLPYLVINFMGSILNVLPDILRKQKIDLIVRTIRLAIESSVILVGIWLYPFEFFVAYYYLILFVLELLYVLFLIWLTGRCEYNSTPKISF